MVAMHSRAFIFFISTVTTFLLKDKKLLRIKFKGAEN